MRRQLSGFALLEPDEQARRLSLIERFALLPAKERAKLLAKMSDDEIAEMIAGWNFWTRDNQRPPRGKWRIWLLMAGRGYGKTRAGAEWILHLAEEPDLRLALVGPTGDEARSVMVEGASGLLASARADARPDWEPSKGLLTWPNGTIATVYSGANAEGLRGPEHDFAWCDEIAKWAQAEAAWDNLMLGLRRGGFPRALATTTPRPTPLMRRLAAQADVATTRGRTGDNAMLATSFVFYVDGLYAGTRLGRQELDGELIEEVEGALWTREGIDRCRVPILPGTVRGTAARSGVVEGAERSCGGSASPLHHASHGPPPRPGEDLLRRVVLGVDPPASAGGTCGIVVCGVDEAGIGYVLDDRSAAGRSPDGWALEVARAAEDWSADLVVAETNQGGDMVAATLRSADCALPVRPVRARFGKGKRAEPVAALFARGRARFAGAFPELEDELCGLTAGGGYEGPGRSPDRADAMVWAMAELMLSARAEPRVRGF